MLRPGCLILLPAALGTGATSVCERHSLADSVSAAARRHGVGVASGGVGARKVALNVEEAGRGASARCRAATSPVSSSRQKPEPSRAHRAPDAERQLR